MIPALVTPIGLPLRRSVHLSFSNETNASQFILSEAEGSQSLPAGRQAFIVR
jgi:hypothetical protein